MDSAATAGAKRKERKQRFKVKLEKLLQEFKSILVVGIDNVGSFQMQKIRIALRGKAVLLMGKNTLIRMILRQQAAQNPKLLALLELVKGNIGFAFTNQELKSIRDILVESKVPACAKTGTFAPTDVIVPPGPTGLDPGQTAFFQAVNITTKIARGSIELVNEVHLIKKGDKITSSAVALLSKLDIKPFFYGVVVLQVFDNGAVYPVEILDVTDDDLMAKFFNGVRKITAISLRIGYPSELTIAHTIANAFKKLLAVSVVSGYKFKELDALSSAAAAPQGGAKDQKEQKGGKGKGKEEDKGGDKGKGKGKGKEEKPKEEEKPKATEDEPPEEEDFGGVGGLFGMGGDD